MERAAIYLAGYLLRKDKIERQHINIIQYGLQMCFEVTISFLASLLISLTLGMLWECIVFFLLFIPLRSRCGGLHLDKYISCFLVSCLSLYGILYAVKYIQFAPLLSIFLAIISLFVINFIKITEDINKPLDKDERHFYISKQKRIFLNIIIFITLLIIFKQDALLQLTSLTLFLMMSSMTIGQIKLYYKKEGLLTQ